MSYVENNLMIGEKIVARTSIHWMRLAPSIGIAALGLVVAATLTAWGGMILTFISLPFLLLAWLERRSTEIAVTTRRVMIKVGLVSRRTVETLLTKVEGIGVEQGIPGRIFGYGTLMITGTGGTKERLTTISDPLGFRRAVQEQIEVQTTSVR